MHDKEAVYRTEPPGYEAALNATKQTWSEPGSMKKGWEGSLRRFGGRQIHFFPKAILADVKNAHNPPKTEAGQRMGDQG